MTLLILWVKESSKRQLCNNAVPFADGSERAALSDPSLRPSFSAGASGALLCITSFTTGACGDRCTASFTACRICLARLCTSSDGYLTKYTRFALELLPLMNYPPKNDTSLV